MVTTKSEPMSQTNPTPSKILYVDDDSDDCIFLMESFAASPLNTDLVCASNGEEAIQYLNAEKDTLPSLIILDLNMPRKDGKQTLRDLKADPQFAGIPVVILSTSRNKIDKDVCTKLGAVSYLEKPFHYEGYKDVVNNCIPLIKHLE